MRPLLVLALAAPLAACTVGEIAGPGGGDDTVGGDDDPVGGDDDPAATPDAATPDFVAVMTPPTIDTTLGTISRYTITLDSTNFAGPVSLVATGVPEGWTAEFDPSAGVTLPLDGQATVDLVITVPSNAAASTATIGVDATAAPGLRQVSAQLAVANEYILTIPSGAGEGTHQMPGTLNLKLGATLRITNGDTIAHRVHSNGGAGFPHQDASMGQGESYVVTPGEAANYTFYCHDHGEGTGVTSLAVRE